jgi:PAS domain S-box-containing protein
MMSSEQMKTLFGLFNFSPVPMWVYNVENLDILAVNDAACECYGYSRDEFLTLKLDKLWPAEDVSFRLQQVSNNAGSKSRFTDTVRHVTCKGKPITVELASEPLPAWDDNARIISALNVTEREKAIEVEKQLRLSNERFNYASRASNEAMFDWDLRIDNIYWADGFRRVFGYPVDGRKYPLSSWADRLHPDDVTGVNESLHLALEDASRNYWSAAYRFRHALGAYLFIEASAYIIRDRNRKAIRMIGALRDVTERKEAAAALEASEKRYSDLFHLSPLPMWVYDVKTYRFLDVNEATVNLYGYSRKEFLCMTLADIRRPEDRDEMNQIIKNSVKRHKYHSALVKHRKKSGEMLIVHVNGNSISYGNKDARVVVAIDVTDKIKSRDALANSERRFRKLIQEGSDLIAVLDDERRYKYVSPAGENAIGLTAEEMLGKYAFDYVHPEDVDRVLRDFEKLNEEKRIELAPFRIVDSKGNIRWVETIATDMREDEAIGGIITNSRDVTQRMLAEAERVRYIQEIEAHNAKLEEITWTQAHLVRAPLARILGIVQLLGDAGLDVAIKETLMSYLQFSATELDEIIRKIIEKSQDHEPYRDPSEP